MRRRMGRYLMTRIKILMMILLPAAVTFILRCVPFMIFGRREMPQRIKRLGKALPYAIMAVLVVYCLRGVTISADIENMALIIASMSVVIIHVLKKNTILSITVGTVLYMILLHV